MPSQADIVTQMVGALSLTDPQLDTSIGSVTRKILDVVGEVAAAAYVDSSVINYAFDINGKLGADLDDFVLMWGFTRLPARRATGVITFSRPVAADQDYAIPAGSQISTSSTPTLVYATTAPVLLVKGTASIDAPVQAVVGGDVSNVTANSITRLASQVSGVTAVNNLVPMSGGTNAEDDVSLIARFKSTVFRSLAGTTDMYQALALEPTNAEAAATQVNVIGASLHWREQIQVAPDRTALSTIPASNVKMIYANTQTLGADIDVGVILTPGIDYTFDNSVVPPRVVGLGTSLTPGDLLDLDFEYCSAASRNNPATGVTNRIDIWVNGSRAVPATQTAYLRSSQVFDNTVGSALNLTNFERMNTSAVRPTAGNVFVRLAFGPVITFPATLTIAGTTLVLGTHYWIVHDTTASGLSARSLFGIEFAAPSAPADGAVILLSGSNTYSYNALPADVQAKVESWRLVTTDVLVHQAKQVDLRLFVAVMFSRGFDPTSTTVTMKAALTHLFNTFGFDVTLQASDLTQAMHNVEGVDNVRFLNSAEPVVAVGNGYGIEVVTGNGTHVSFVSTTGSSPQRATDLVLGDNQVPVLYDIIVVPKAQNSFSAGT